MTHVIKYLRRAGHHDLARAVARVYAKHVVDNVKNAGSYYYSADEALDDLGFVNPLKRSEDAAKFIKQMADPSMFRSIPKTKLY